VLRFLFSFGGYGCVSRRTLEEQGARGEEEKSALNTERQGVFTVIGMVRGGSREVGCVQGDM